MKKENIAITKYITALQELHSLGVLKSKHDFTSQIGEWLVETIYNGKRANSSIQRGWDVHVNGYNIQVKAHAKAEGNSNRWSAVDKNESDKIDELIIIQFTPYYKIINFYRIPWSEALKHIKLRNIKSPRYQLSWSDVKSFSVNLSDLPKQNIISIFR